MALFLIIYVLLSLVLMVASGYYLNRNSVKYMKNIPTPPSKSWFGNLADFLFCSTDEFFEKIMEKAQYGSLIKFKMGLFTDVLVVTDEKFTEYILNSQKHITKADPYDFFHNWLGKGIFTSTGNEFRQRKRAVASAFHFSLMDQFVEVFEKCGDILIQKLDKFVNKDSTNVYPLISLFSLDSILEAAMGTSVDAQNNENCNYVKMIKLICYIINRRVFSPLPIFLYPLSPLYYKEKKALKILHSYADNIIDMKLKENKTKAESSSVTDRNGVQRRLTFLDLFIQYNLNGKLSKRNLREEINTILSGGQDTTASTIAFALYALANNPEIQEKVVAEQRQLFGDIKNVTNPSEKFNEMKYLELVIKETLRCYNTVPILGRKLAEDFEFEGNVFPKGLNCSFMLQGIHLNPKHFPDPKKFKPERFLEKSEKNNLIYLPFSAGPRTCPGQKFASLEMKSCISKIVRNFELYAANPNPPLKLAPELILVSKNGVNISIKRR